MGLSDGDSLPFLSEVGIVAERYLAKVQARFRLPHFAPIFKSGHYEADPNFKSSKRGTVHHKIKQLMSKQVSDEFSELLEEILMAFADSIAKLQADVAKLVAENGPAAVAAAVAAKDSADAAAVDAVDATVVAAIAPAPAPAAPAAPAA